MAIKKFDLIFALVLKNSKAILPLLFSWILILGFTGLACSLHLCHTGEDGFQAVEAAGHDHHGEDEGCCDVVSELLRAEKEFLSASGKSFSVDFLAADSPDTSLPSHQRVKREPLPLYDPPISVREIHILHQVFII